MTPRHCLDTIVNAISGGVRVALVGGALAGAQNALPQQPKGAAPLPYGESGQVDGPRSGQCSEVVGEQQDFIVVEISDILAPYAAVYDPDPTHTLTGHKFVVTDETNGKLYTVSEDGQNVQQFSVALPGAIKGRGITIGGKPVLPQDYIFAANNSGQIHAYTFGGIWLDQWVQTVTSVGGICWDPVSSTLLAYDKTAKAIRQYNIQNGSQMSVVSINKLYCVGIAYDACNGKIFISETGGMGFWEGTPHYTNGVLDNVEGLTEHDWSFPNGYTMNDVLGISYRLDIKQLIAVNGWDSNYDPGIATSIDDACCPPGDLDGDGNVDADDAAMIMYCQTGPDTSPTGTCVFCDLDGDDDVDMHDMALYQLMYQPTP